ncbi:MAG: hypothetical protein AB7J30_01145 [Hyphomicrobium sp.]|uniref:hypothetical protein n=1 Tax=Hyphomicrobium sp. TaxID=82 RepID=UPI003D0CCE99
MTRHRLAWLMATAGLAIAPHAARADMGKAPTPGIIVSIEGGFLYQDTSAIIGHGVSDVIVNDPSDPVTDVLVSAEDGYFVAGNAGFNSTAPLLFGFHRIEGYLLYGETDDSAADTSPPTTDIVLVTVDGLVIGVGADAARTTVERRTWEGGLRFEDDDVINATSTVTWVLAPFIRNLEQDSRTVASVCCDFVRTSKLDATLYGVFVAAEPETWLTSNLALVGRLGAGVYGYDGDGKFRSFGTFDTTGDFDASLSDGDSGGGFRGLLGIGLKLKVAPAALLEGFAEADYFSKVPTAELPPNNPAGTVASHVGDDDLWEMRTGVRLTVGLSN